VDIAAISLLSFASHVIVISWQYKSIAAWSHLLPSDIKKSCRLVYHILLGLGLTDGTATANEFIFQVHPSPVSYVQSSANCDKDIETNSEGLAVVTPFALTARS